MILVKKNRLFKKYLFVTVCISCVAACSSAPSKEIATTALKKILPMSFSIEWIRPVKGISGLSEVVAVSGGQPMVFYIDKKGSYIISGNIVDAQTKQNLTIEAIQKFKDQKK